MGQRRRLVVAAALCSLLPGIAWLVLHGAALRAPRSRVRSADTGFEEGLGSAVAPDTSGRLPARLRASDVLVGLMSCARYHPTRLAFQQRTWLQHFRHVVLFTDSGNEASDALRLPTFTHAFAPHPDERTYLTGAWRAVPIVRSLARYVASLPTAEQPLWIYSLDDDAYVIVPNLLRTLARYDPRTPTLVGAATLSPVGLHGISSAGYQPHFINGGPGYALTRSALAHFAGARGVACEQRVRWDWMGDMRVSRCLADAGVRPTWERGFHTEDPSAMRAHGQLLPGRSTAVAFHHLSAEQAALVSRAHEVVTDGGASVHDFGALAFAQLAGSAFGVRFNVTLGWDGTVSGASASGAAPAQVVARELAAFERDEDTARAGASSDSLERLAHAFARARAAGATEPPTRFIQRFRGGACEVGEPAALVGGHSLVVALHCAHATDDDTRGDDDGARASDSTLAAGVEAGCVPTAGGLVAVCGAVVDANACSARLDLLVACPRPRPRPRAGLDATLATAAGDAAAANTAVAFDGEAIGSWRPSECVRQAKAPTDARCARAPTRTLRLLVRAAIGEVQLRPPTFTVETAAPDGARVAVRATLGKSDWTARGPSFAPTIPRPATSSDLHEQRDGRAGEDEPDPSAEQRGEPLGAEPVELVVTHDCEPQPGAAGAVAEIVLVTMQLGVRGYAPLQVAWEYECRPSQTRK